MATTITVPVVLCGGTGKRLWPLSRRHSPKQFLPLLEGASLFEQAVLRGLSISNSPIGNNNPLLCVTVDEHKFMVQDALKTLNVDADILVEPQGRNTTAALCMAALWLSQRHDDATMVILPSDQVIDGTDEWRDAVGLGQLVARNGRWVSLGIRPDHPSGAFGYIQPGREHRATPGVFCVDSFVEKPEATIAGELCKQGWLWNAGVAIVQVETVLNMISVHAPEVFSACRDAMEEVEGEQGFHFPDRRKYSRVPAVQIDEAVLENSDNISVVPFAGQWRDIGNWQALEQLTETNGCGNRVSGDVVVENCQKVYVHSPHRLVVALGLEDITIVDTPDALLVADKGTLDNLGGVVDQLALDDRPQADIHLRVERPWGHYDVKAQEPGYKVKCVLVRPGASLSSQFHYHRAEHWIVVKGTATISCDGKERQVGVNESVYIPQGTIHRLENRTEQLLELVEVQTGDYLGEDDIVRLDDEYGRV